MPRIKRWFPVSHDFNHDPEVRKLREETYDWMGYGWLELLSIADKNDGFVKGDDGIITRVLASTSMGSRVDITLKQGRSGLDWMLNHGWIERVLGGIRICNYAKYHRPREIIKSHAGNIGTSTRPDLTGPILKSSENSPQSGDSTEQSEQQERPMSVQDLVDTWNANFQNKLPTVYWPLSKGREVKARARLREHPTVEFWTAVFDQIVSSEFLLGLGRRKSHENWRCTFDFVIQNDTNCMKIAEGVYGKGDRDGG